MNIKDLLIKLEIKKKKTLLLLSVIVVQLFSIWSLSVFIPFQDYYDWIYQSQILFEIWNGNPIAETHFGITSFWEFPPNGFITLFLALLQFLVSPSTAGKILLSIIILLFNLGGYLLVISIQPKSPFRFLVLLFPFHFFFYKGFLSYCLGLAILLNLIAFLNRNRNWKAIYYGLFFLTTSLFVFSVHGFIYGVYVFAILVWLVHPSNRKIGLQAKILSLAALVPGAILLVLYVFSSSGNADSFTVLYHSLVHWAQIIRYGTHFFARIAMNPTWLPLSFLNFGIIIFVMFLFLSYRKQLQKSSYTFVLFISFLGMMFLNPFYQIGLFFPLSSRLVLLIMLLFASLFLFDKPKKKIEYLILFVALLISLSHAIHLNTFDKSNKEFVTSLKKVVEKDPQIFVLAKTFPYDLDKSLHTRFSGTTDPYIFLNSALNTTSLSSLHYIQQTGIVKPLSDTAIQRSYLGGLIFDTPQLETTLNNIYKHQHAFSKEFSTIILIGSTETKTKLAQAFAPSFELVESTNDFSTLKRH